MPSPVASFHKSATYDLEDGQELNGFRFQQLNVFENMLLNRVSKVLKTILRADGKRRVLIVQRDDGRYSFKEETGFDSPYGKHWAALPPRATICDTMEHAESEAYATIDWLISNK
jgi:hypothetical protein